ncbi:AAA family ATPase [Acinetobacter johnsonii]|nr:AAA family ATPase [Acinetobacter johnsonii]
MITGFTLHNVATYKNKVDVDGLKKLNFFYGTNGCGKTTISRLLANPNDHKFSKSIVSNVNRYKTYVYNQDFIEQNFHLNDHLNGVFTLGDDAKEAEIQIAKIKNEIEGITKDTDEKKKVFDEQNDQSLVNQQRIEREKLVVRAWEFKKGIEEKSELIRTLLTGFNNSKDAFFNELIRRLPQAQAKLEDVDLDELIHGASIIYGDEQSQKSEVTKISLDGLVSLLPLPELSEVIVNSTSNNQISELIEKINHLSWFEKGIEFLKINDSSCPFCNKNIDDDLMLLINKSIDQSYKDKKEKIQEYYENYTKNSDDLIETLTAKLSVLACEVDVSNAQKNLEIIDLKLKENLKLIKVKLENLNQIVTLEKFSDLINELNLDIEKYNGLVKKHNQLILNRKSEEIELKNQLWNFILLELDGYIESYKNNNDELNIKIIEAKAQVQANIDSIKKLNLEKAQWATKASVTEATCIAINKLLGDFGFNSFSLDFIPESGHYQIIREDGSEAKNTLSEGEKTFITFLYFYHLIRGGDTTDNISLDKIIVIDDPISSLDSDVLFIVSTLIKGVYRQILDNNSYLKQLVLLTHNIHFFMELTKLSYKWFKDNTNYYLVRKNVGVSSITYKDENPIRSSYENLWSELQYFRDNNLAGIQNCMRRILENYFTHWGYAKDLDKLVDIFIGNERLVYKSLVNWMHSGSHQILDSFYVTDLEYETEIYLDIFKRIFEETNQIGHYNMMMKIEDAEFT